MFCMTLLSHLAYLVLMILSPLLTVASVTTLQQGKVKLRVQIIPCSTSRMVTTPAGLLQQYSKTPIYRAPIYRKPRFRA